MVFLRVANIRCLVMCVMTFLWTAEGHARYMVTTKCSLPIAVGSSIMGTAVASGNSQKINVARNGVNLASGSTYTPGETLTVTMTNNGGTEYVFETNKGSFVGGGCAGNKRKINSAASLVLPAAGSGSVTIIGGWASQEAPVKILSAFVLNEAAVTAPTASPTFRPSTIAPTKAPSAKPSAKPSAVPTIAPTVMPTQPPHTATPTETPTAQPTFAQNSPTPEPTMAPSSKPTAEPTSHKPTTAPTNAPSRAPTAAPTPAPSTSAPTYEYPLTSRPTTAVLTLVTVDCVQQINNITAADIGGSEDVTQALTATLQTTLTQSMSQFGVPAYINITSIDTVEPAARRLGNGGPEAATKNLRHPCAVIADAVRRALSTDPPPSVSVRYSIVYFLEQTEFATAEDLHASVNVALTVIMDSPLFVTTLQTYGVAALSGITSTALTQATLGPVQVLRSPRPTAYPTEEPYNPNVVPRDDDAYTQSQDPKIIVGLVVGGVGVVAVVATLWLCASAEEHSPSLLSVQRVLVNLPLVAALALCVVAIALVAAWVRDVPADSTDYGYLGKPGWKHNVFAYHVIFMVLFFVCQVQAICNWSLFRVAVSAKTAHVLVQLGSIATMVTALVAVVKYEWNRTSPSLTTMHSWIGVAGVAVFGANFLWGSGMSTLKVWFAESPLRSRLQMLPVHKYLGASALVLTVMAVNTGIMDKLPWGSCNYQLDEGVQYRKDYDPAENYPYQPNSCKIANGLGLTVMLGGLFTLLAVMVRHLIPAAAVEPVPVSTVVDKGPSEAGAGAAENGDYEMVAAGAE